MTLPPNVFAVRLIRRSWHYPIDWECQMHVEQSMYVGVGPTAEIAWDRAAATASQHTPRPKSILDEIVIDI